MDPQSFHEYYPSPSGGDIFWTGSELLVGGAIPSLYDPVADRWRPGAVPANIPVPSGAAVWTGAEMLVWMPGGNGGRYDPAADTWTAMAPLTVGGRSEFSMVWAGDRMIAWGGTNGGGVCCYFDTGFIYRPTTDTWRQTPALGVPEKRAGHTAVWTGSEMIVWGGRRGGTLFNSGGRYDPVADTWTPTGLSGGLPSARIEHRAVWTGTRMMVWGGQVDSGGLYDPITDSWKMTSRIGAPSPRSDPTMVFDGSRVMVWGGRFGSPGLLDDGARYDPASDAWTTMASAGAPSPRYLHGATWTGSEMHVWGGRDNGWIADGARYDPSLDRWTPIASTAEAPSSRWNATAHWTGTEMIVWGGNNTFDYLNTGSRYEPISHRWSRMSQGFGTPPGRADYTSIWTGDEMIVFGGFGVGPEGSRYDPVRNAWTPIAPGPDPPSGRYNHTAVWTGTEMIVWGGVGYLNTGGRYDPLTDTWLPTSTGFNVPTGRFDHTAVWAGNRMVIWGGRDVTSFYFVNTGGRYDPVTDTWQPTSVGQSTPSARYSHVMVSTGPRAIVWAGHDPNLGTDVLDGATYDPATDGWSPMSITNAPPEQGLARWNGAEMVVFGGRSSSNLGFRYDPSADSWRAMSTVGAPQLQTPVAASTDQEMIVWGTLLQRGAIYDYATDTWSPHLRFDANLLAGMPPGGTAAYTSRLTGYRADGTTTPTDFEPFPSLPGHGVHATVGDVEPGSHPEIVAAPGPGPTLPPRVAGYDRDGIPLAGLSVDAYGTVGYGARVSVGAIDQKTRILTGPGPSGVYGPHVRAFGWDLGSVSALPRVSFFAYGTLRFGAHVATADSDADGYREIVTGAGTGVVFGPHVRGFDYDGTALRPIPRMNFFAYGSLQYGVEVGAGDVEGDGFAELLTGPGPSPAFPSQLRGFEVDGGPVQSIGRINTVVFPGSTHGLNAAGGDVDHDGYDEVVCGAGPDPNIGSLSAAFDADSGSVLPILALSRDVFGLGYGLRVSAGDLDR